MFKGDLPLTINWFHNGKTLTNGNGQLLTQASSRTSTLTIESVTGFHRGVYKCTASNIAGSAEYSSSLNIKGAQ